MTNERSDGNHIKVSAVLLAAGLSKRMGTDKLLLEFNGKSFLRHSVDLLYGLPVFQRIIVTSAARSDQIDILPDKGLFINSGPEEGLAGSVRIGVEAATGTHFLFLTADQPKLTPGDILPLLEAAGSYPDKIIHPVIDSKPSSPTLFPERFRMQLLSLSGDNGGRSVRDGNKKHCLAIEPEFPGNFKDIDVVEDYNDLF